MGPYGPPLTTWPLCCKLLWLLHELLNNIAIRYIKLFLLFWRLIVILFCPLLTLIEPNNRGNKASMLFLVPCMVLIPFIQIRKLKSIFCNFTMTSFTGKESVFDRIILGTSKLRKVYGKGFLEWICKQKSLGLKEKKNLYFP